LKEQGRVLGKVPGHTELTEEDDTLVTALLVRKIAKKDGW